MALIKCPECEQEISDTCEKCIHCGYTLSQSINKSKKIKFTNWKIILGTITIIAVFLVVFYSFSQNDPFKKYTNYIGKQYTDLTEEYEVETVYYDMVTVSHSYLPGQMEFDKFDGTLSYTYLNEDDPVINNKAGEIISMSWSVESDSILESDIDAIIKTLESVYGKCENVDRNEYTMEYIWENANQLDVRFNAVVDSFYVIGWNKH